MKKVAVVGLGYVGLPLALLAANSGHTVTGIDLDKRKVDNLNLGLSHLENVSDEDVVQAMERGLRASTSFAEIQDCDIVIVCVPTPLQESGRPDMSFVWSSVRSAAPYLKRGAALVLESTSMPGTTSAVQANLSQEFGLEVDVDYFLGFSPERVDPGNKRYTIANTPKIVAGASEESSRLIENFYATIVRQIVVSTRPIEAEMAKLFENAFRLVNISLVNEFARECRLAGVDSRRILELSATKPFGFLPFSPGIGAGGHCIPVDPTYLNEFFFSRGGKGIGLVELASEVNNSIPSDLVVFFQAQHKAGNGSELARDRSALILGVGYKPNSNDSRESAALRAAGELDSEGFKVTLFDPLAPVTNGLRVAATLAEVLNQDFDFILLAQAHDFFLTQEFAQHLSTWSSRGAKIVDATGRFNHIDSVVRF